MDYRGCMSDGLKRELKGKKMAKEERRQTFCELAKVCSGKAKTREEARELCTTGIKRIEKCNCTKELDALIGKLLGD